MLKIAITGGIACGKSLIGGFLRDMGVGVLDSDDIAHRLLAEDDGICRNVVNVFGEDILDSTGKIDRGVLGSKVFSDPAKLQRLNNIVHPVVKDAWSIWLEEQDLQDRNGAVVIVPLLFESGFHEGWNGVICVTASLSVRVARMKVAGFENIDDRIRSQAQSEIKMNLADYVLVNNGSRQNALRQLDMIWKKIMEK